MTCGKNDATIHMTEIINGHMKEVHICGGCAKEKGTDFKTYFGAGPDEGDDLFNLFSATVGEKKRKAELICPECRMTPKRFEEVGRLGCEHCYEAFEVILTPLLRRIHRNTQHAGKIPQGRPLDKKARESLRTLKSRLADCIRKEAFEDAAELRDKIQKMEKQATAKKRKATS